MLFDAADFPPLGAASPARLRGQNDQQRPAVRLPQEQRPPADTTEVLIGSQRLTSTSQQYASVVGESRRAARHVHRLLPCTPWRPHNLPITFTNMCARLRQRVRSSLRRKRLRGSDGQPSPLLWPRRPFCWRAAGRP